MAIEIERKFLVTDSSPTAPWRQGKSEHVVQGYLSIHPDRAMRVRLSDSGKAMLTIKGKSDGISRTEFDYPIPSSDAREMLDSLCLRPWVEKTRFRLGPWEVDEFHGENAGLVVAEIELKDEKASFDHPSWIGIDVSHDPRYYNAALVEHPYRLWKENA